MSSSRDPRRCGALTLLAWGTPLLLYAADAAAWGLYTHVYFAQALLLTVPIADPRFRRALARCPELFLAGTCLPDVSLTGGILKSRALSTTHQWSAAAAMLRRAEGDEERAIATGFAAHLLTDIVAHNYFVPAHDGLWFRCGVLSHAVSEWAMDAHVSSRLRVRPGTLIRRNAGDLAHFAQARLGVERALAARALGLLGRGERLLRASGLPHLIHGASRRADASAAARFERYLRETAARLPQVNRLIAGETPRWLPEPDTASLRLRRDGGAHYPYMSLLPSDFFRDVARAK